MSPNNFAQIIAKLSQNLETIEKSNYEIIPLIEKSILVCKDAIAQLRSMVQENEFKTKDEEIKFFKFIKPQANSKLIYYVMLFELESNRSNCCKIVQIKYLQKNFSSTKNTLIITLNTTTITEENFDTSMKITL